MSAQVIERFGGASELVERRVPVPAVGPSDVLIRVEAAGVGAWDREEREGLYASEFGIVGTFPYVLGWEGAGVAAAVGSSVESVRVGDPVFAVSMPVPRGGFYAEYAVVDEEHVAKIPESLDATHASALGWDAVTAMSGIDALGLDRGQSIAILGASGGIGHLALQLAREAGLRVLAVASGQDGVALARSLGADAAVDGRREDVADAAVRFAPQGLDGALTTVGGSVAATLSVSVRPGGALVWPNGVTPVPHVAGGRRAVPFDGDRSSVALRRLTGLVDAGVLRVHLDRVFAFDQVRAAHEAIDGHVIGKIALAKAYAEGVR